MPIGNSEKIKDNLGLEIIGVRNVADTLNAVFS